MKILITTGIYPPKIGGPAQYAKSLRETLESLGHEVKVSTYNIENRIPSGIRHFYFFIKIIPAIIFCDFVIIMDTFSVGLPTVFATKLFGKKSIMRVAGDFLWEQYVGRTGKKVLFGNFYNNEKENFNRKEKVIFSLTNWLLRNTTKIVFSTDWQRYIFLNAYSLNKEKTCLVENFYGPKESDKNYESKTFIVSARDTLLKNFDILEKVFDRIKSKNTNIQLFKENLPYQKFMDKIANSYAVILVSIGDISPNIILEAIRYNRPFVCTREVGIYERIQSAGIFVDPLNEREIELALRDLLTESGYNRAKEKVRNFNFIHTWEEIANEFILTYSKL